MQGGGRSGGSLAIPFGTAQADDADPQARPGAEDAVVAVAVDAAWWDKAAEGGEELERQEREDRAAVGRGAQLRKLKGVTRGASRRLHSTPSKRSPQRRTRSISAP